MNEEKYGKFESKTDGGICLGYVYESKGYRCYNKRTQGVIESINVKVDEALPHNEVIT